MSKIYKYNELEKQGLTRSIVNSMVANGDLIKIKQGFYSTSNDNSEIAIIKALVPDGILCGNTALYYYGYSNRSPLSWEIAVKRKSSPNKFNLDYPKIKPHFISDEHLTYGVCEQVIDNVKIKMFDKDRTICEMIYNEKKMDKELFNICLWAYMKDKERKIPKLMEYAKRRRVHKRTRRIIELWP
jgi:predicted transcriptional regulator of viral defense system